MLVHEHRKKTSMCLFVAVTPYEGNDSWVEDALRRAKFLVSEVRECPEHAPDCEHGRYLREVADTVAR